MGTRIDSPAIERVTNSPRREKMVAGPSKTLGLFILSCNKLRPSDVIYHGRVFTSIVVLNGDYNPREYYVVLRRKICNCQYQKTLWHSIPADAASPLFRNPASSPSKQCGAGWHPAPHWKSALWHDVAYRRQRRYRQRRPGQRRSHLRSPSPHSDASSGR